MMEKIRSFFVSPEGIGFLKAILDSYEDVGILSVKDGGKGMVDVTCSSFFEQDLNGIVRDMARYGITIKEVSGD